VKSVIVDTPGGVTVLGAGEVSAAVLSQALTIAPLLVAADGGAASALKHGHMPAAVIGDLDSLDAATRAAVPPDRIHRIPDQDSTDFDKCLATIRAPIVLAVGFTGARLDHELAAFSTLVAQAARPAVLLGPEDAVFVAPERLELSLGRGTRLSLFPMGEVTGESEGLRWPIGGLAFAPGGRIGTSNETVAGRVCLRFSARRMLVFVPRACLGAVVSALVPELAARASARGG
jgi:thiamine pyrophosphokinase